MPQNFTFALDPELAIGAVQLDPSAHPELLKSLLDNAALPDGDNVIEGADLQVAPGQPIALGPAQVGFKAEANALLGVYSTPGNLRAALLRNADLVEQIADAITLPKAEKLLLLRWGYDISGQASGAVALGPGASLRLTASGEAVGYFAIVQGVRATSGTRESLTSLVRCWKLPSQVNDISKLPESTMLLSEVDGSFLLGAKATFGYDFNWVRAVDNLGLKGDIGLKLQAGLTAALSFGMTGKYALMMTREDADPEIRMRIYKLRAKNLNLAVDASLIVTPETPAPDSLSDLLKAITGTHEQQIIKLLGDVRDWTDPNKPIFGPFVNMADAEARKLVQSITGIPDLSVAFDTAKARIQNLFSRWNSLPQTAARFLWAKLPDPAAITEVTAIARKISNLSSDDLTAFIQSKLTDVEFLNSDAGKTLESLAVSGLFAALQDNTEVKGIRSAAMAVVGLLDGSDLQKLVTNLQNEINTRLDLKHLEDVVDQTTFDSLDTWLKARLEDFLEQRLVGAQGLAELQQLRANLRTIFSKADELYNKALAAVRNNYTFAFHAAFQSTSTNSALLDARFNFGAADSQASEGLRLALAGKFDQLLRAPLRGVTITDGVLAYALRRETHVTLSLPYFSTTSVHVNDSVAQLQVISADEGGLLFGLQSSDTYTVRNDYSSALTIGMSVPGRQNRVRVHGSTASWRYGLKVGMRSLTARNLAAQFAPYADTYFPHTFQQQSPGSFADWAEMIAPSGGQFGNSLVCLDVSLASSAASAWIAAPGSESDPAYKKLSMALQAQFRQLLHDVFFSDINKYNDVSGDTAARAVLAFCSIPPCSDVKLINGGTDVEFLDEKAGGKNVYWDYRDRGVNPFSVDLRERVLFHRRTQTNLARLLQIAQQRLTDAGDPNHKLGFYASDQIGAILGAALHGQLLDFLFPVEANMVSEAVAAGIRMAAFRQSQFTNPDAARKNLANFGSKLAADFNKSLSNFAVGDALLPLGTAIYLTGALVLDPGIDTTTAAMLTIQTLRAGVTGLSPADTDVLHTARVVNGSLPTDQVALFGTAGAV